MSRDKQISDMQNLLWCRVGFLDSDESVQIAEALYNAGYRKASEIFEEIESVLLDKDSPLTVWCAINGQKYAELKKKYTEREKEK